MANIDDAYRIEKLSLEDKTLVVTGLVAPNVGVGYEAPQGSLYLLQSATTTGDLYVKFGPANVDWKAVSTSGGPTTPLQYFHAHNALITQALSLTYVNAIIGTDVISDAIYTNVNGAVTINKTGRFKIESEIGAVSAAARSVSVSIITINGIQVAGTASYGYHRNKTAGENTASTTAIVNITTGDVVNVIIRKRVGAVTTKPNACRLTISELE